MSLVVSVKNFQALKCKGEKFVRIDFRGNYDIYYMCTIITHAYLHSCPFPLVTIVIVFSV